MDLLEQYGLQPRFIAEAAAYPNESLARITAQHRGEYRIVTRAQSCAAVLSGRLRHQTEQMVALPTVGDYVMVTAEGEQAVIHRVLPRKSIFVRSAVGTTGQAQSVAANIDTVFLCVSLNRNFSLNRIERYLSVAWDSGATPVVLLTKADLCEDLQQMRQRAEQVCGFAEVIALSALEQEVLPLLAKYLQGGQTIALIGSSGVGKSTLINRLLGAQVMQTAAIGKEDKGRHTTTGREMLLCPQGAVLIDTPGMRELGIESADVESAFEDIAALSAQCKFADCTHTSEPGCAVLAAVEQGKLEQRRLASYQKLSQQAGYEGLSAKQIEVKKLSRMCKDIGGMKNMRKFAREQQKRKR